MSTATTVPTFLAPARAVHGHLPMAGAPLVVTVLAVALLVATTALMAGVLRRELRAGGRPGMLREWRTQSFSASAGSMS